MEDGTKIDSLVIDVEVNSSEAETRLKSLQTTIKGVGTSSGTSEKQTKGLTKAMNGVSSAISTYNVISGAVGAVLSKTIGKMNDYVETLNYAHQAMGEAYQSAYEYSQKVSDSFGIDQEEWLDAQTTFYSIANGFGMATEQTYQFSKGLTELAYDMSSLTNTDVATAVEKLTSAVTGVTRPIKAWGVNISVAAMKQWMLKNGIEETYSSLSEGSKAMVRYQMIVETLAKNGAIGDLANTLSTPSNAIRILRQQFIQLARAIGSIFIPVLTQVLPYIQAFVNVLTGIISRLAKLFGFEMPEWTENDWGGGFGETADDIDSATASAKKFKKQLMGFDEINNITPSSSSSSGSSGGGGVDLGMDLSSVWDSAIFDSINSKVDAIKEKMGPWLEIILKIGAAFALWKIGSSLYVSLANIATKLMLIGGSANFTSTAIGLIIAGLYLLVDGFMKFIKTGELSKETFTEIAVGFALIGVAISLLTGTWIPLIIAAVAAFATWVVGNWDEVKEQSILIWNDIVTFLKGIWDGVATFFKGILDNMKSNFKTVTDGMKNVWSNFRDALKIIGDRIKENWNIAMTAIKTIAGNIVDGIKLKIAEIKGKFEAVITTIKTLWSTMWDGLETKAEEKIKTLVGKFLAIKTGFKDIINSLISFVESSVNRIVNAFNTSGLIRGVNKILGTSITLGTISIPRLENGGILEDGLFTMNHGEIAGQFTNGQSVVANNEQIIEGIKRGVYEAMQASNGNTTISIEGDPQGMFKTFVREHNRTVYQMGASPLAI